MIAHIRELALRPIFVAVALVTISGIAALAVTWMRSPDLVSQTDDAWYPPSLLTCADFEDWNAVVDYLDSHPMTENTVYLDSNRNGIPCEMLIPTQPPAEPHHQIRCDDFQHRDEAEYFFEKYDAVGENRYGLDTDLDGRPCESLPPLDKIERVLNRLNRIWNASDRGRDDDLNCSDFVDWGEANAAFTESGGPMIDPHNLDADSDGVPCESLPGSPTRNPGSSEN